MIKYKIFYPGGVMMNTLLKILGLVAIVIAILLSLPMILHKKIP
jgi:hypothetical protein